MDSLPPTDAILFRPSKKRKIYRQRAVDPNETEPQSVPATAAAVSTEAQSIDELIASTGTVIDGVSFEGAQVPISEILRLRKRNRKVAGVEFRAKGSGHLENHEERQDGEVVVREPGVPRKFAPQTGTVADVDKHM